MTFKLSLDALSPASSARATGSAGPVAGKLTLPEGRYSLADALQLSPELDAVLAPLLEDPTYRDVRLVVPANNVFRIATSTAALPLYPSGFSPQALRNVRFKVDALAALVFVGYAQAAEHRSVLLGVPLGVMAAVLAGMMWMLPSATADVAPAVAPTPDQQAAAVTIEPLARPQDSGGWVVSSLIAAAMVGTLMCASAAYQGGAPITFSLLLMAGLAPVPLLATWPSPSAKAGPAVTAAPLPEVTVEEVAPWALTEHHQNLFGMGLVCYANSQPSAPPVALPAGASPFHLTLMSEEGLVLEHATWPRGGVSATVRSITLRPDRGATMQGELTILGYKLPLAWLPDLAEGLWPRLAERLPRMPAHVGVSAAGHAMMASSGGVVELLPTSALRMNSRSSLADPQQPDAAVSTKVAIFDRRGQRLLHLRSTPAAAGDAPIEFDLAPTFTVVQDGAGALQPATVGAAVVAKDSTAERLFDALEASLLPSFQPWLRQLRATQGAGLSAAAGASSPLDLGKALATLLACEPKVTPTMPPRPNDVVPGSFSAE